MIRIGNDLNVATESVIEVNEDMARRYYKTRRAAEKNRRKGERIYYTSGKGYYIIRPKKQGWLDFF